MRNAPIVPGVPSPYAMHVHPYPTRFHGAIYTRPVFSGRMIASPQDVFTSSYNIDRNMPQPTLSGLGAVQSQWDTGEGIFKPGGYGGGVFDGDISGLGTLSQIRRQKSRGYRPVRGLGDDASDYPWKVKSDKTAALQAATNQLLAEAALCPLTVDGKLGPGTCGARKYLNDNKDKFFTGISEIANPSTCLSFTLPATLASGCGAGKAPSSISTAPQPVIDLDASAGMSSSTKRALGFAFGGILAIGAVVMLRKKR